MFLFPEINFINNVNTSEIKIDDKKAIGVCINYMVPNTSLTCYEPGTDTQVCHKLLISLRHSLDAIGRLYRLEASLSIKPVGFITLAKHDPSRLAACFSNNSHEA